MANQGRVFPKGVFGMTRDEQMWEAVEQEHGNLSRREAFVTLTALEWADKTMIEKATQWIESYLFDIGFPDDWCRDSATMKSGKQRFLEAMEE